VEDKKIKLEDLGEEDFERARQIIHAIVASTTKSPKQLGRLVLSQIVTGKACGEGFRSGFKMAAKGNKKGKVADKEVDNLVKELDESLRDGLPSRTIKDYDGLREQFNAQLAANFHNNPNELFETPPNKKYVADLVKGCDGASLVYCGLYWLWWLARYMIAAAWGCPLDQEKLFLLYAFCMHCPLVGERGGKLVILPKPEKVNWHLAGETAPPFRFPIYELHGNGKPSIEYWGLFNCYHWHNVAIPERMGKANCEHWKPEWLLDEKNSEVRRILLREIGYERAMAKLGATSCDTWREYELLKLHMTDMPVEYKLLKMTCPSTGDIHVLRVPPDTKSAEAGVTWVNHGTHPDSFEKQA